MTALRPEVWSARDKIENLFCKGDDNAARDGEKAVGSLRRVVAFKRETDLHDAESEKDQTDSADETEHEVGQVVHDLQRIAASRKRRHRHHAGDSDHKDNGAVSNKALSNFSLNGEGRG